jgi:predicted kinase
LFDAIEFDARIATGDVFYDLAFLLMDLIERGLQPQANIVLNRYLSAVNNDGNLDALAALPLFMSVRAAIRAKVTAARRQHAKDADEAAKSARDYFALANRLLAPPPPRLVAVGGLSGTGKSVLARALASYLTPAPGAVLLRSDVERKLMFGVGETEKLPPSGYAHDVTAKVYAALAAKAARIVAAGHSAVVDAVFARAEERDSIARAADKAPFHGLFLTADLDTRVARIGARVADASDADATVARRQEDYGLGTMRWTKVDASGTPQDTLDRARSALKLR